MSLDPAEVSAVRARLREWIETISAELWEPARAAFDRIASDQWLLEWRLPRWLGEAFNLETGTVDSLVLCNVAGLAYVRLMDDLADETGARRASDVGLANALYAGAISRYARMVQSRPAATTAFLDQLDLHMGHWIRAMLASNRPPATPEGDGAALLAARGAPLKIGVAVACLVAGREYALAE